MYKRQRLGQDDDVLPIDANILELIVALNVLGLPTFSSCGGHDPALEEDPEFVRWPMIMIGYLLPARFGGFANDDLTQDQRREMIAYRWRTLRPLAHQLQSLLEQFRRETGRELLFRARVRHWGLVALVPAALQELWDLEETSDPSVSVRMRELHVFLNEFGRFLRREATGRAELVAA